MASSGLTLGYFLAYLLKKISGDLTGESFWPIIFGFPLLIICLQSFVLLYIYPFETPKYWLLAGNEAEARRLIS